MRALPSFFGSGAPLLLVGCFGFGENHGDPDEPCRPSDCTENAFHVSVRVQPSAGVEHRIRATLCGGRCVSAILTDDLAHPGQNEGVLFYRGGHASGDPDDAYMLVASGSWPGGALDGGSAFRFTVVDEGDGRTLADESFGGLDRADYDPEIRGTCYSDGDLTCRSFAAESSRLSKRPCVVADCENRGTEVHSVDLSRAAVLATLPPDEDPGRGRHSSLEVTICRNGGCHTFGVFAIREGGKDFFSCPRTDQRGQTVFRCTLTDEGGDLLRLVADTGSGVAWTDEPRFHEIVVRDLATGEVLNDSRIPAAYVPSGCAAADDSVCDAAEAGSGEG